MSLNSVIYNIEDLIHRTEWLKDRALTTTRGPLVSPDHVYVSFNRDKNKAKEQEGPVDKILIRIGNQILTRLDWHYKDRIIVDNHPDDLMLFKLYKPDTKVGRIITRDTKNSGALLRTWTYPLTLDVMPYTLVKHYIYKNHILIFRVGKEELILT